MEALIGVLIFILLLAAIAWAWRLFRAAFRKTEQTAPPTLASLLDEEPDMSLTEQVLTFRRPHVVQTIVYLIASAAILVSFLVAFIGGGWTLLSLLLAAAEVLLLLTHGTPLLVSAVQSLTISPEGIQAKGLFRQRAIHWWEVRQLMVVDDLSRFRAETSGSRFTYDASAFPTETKLDIYRSLRAHLISHQQDLQSWPQGSPRLRFFRANALSIVLFVVAMVVTAFIGREILPEGRVLGLRCGYASHYLRQRYDLPDRQGCVILRVNPGTGAYEAGLREGDMIVALEGVPITSGPQFTVFWKSLDRAKEKFTVIHPGETEPMTVGVKLGPPGRLPEYDPEDPYFFYLRARGATNTSQAIADYTTAIELAPDFDLAYVYRGDLYSDELVDDLALADFNRALDLDNELTEAYRERAWHLILRLGNYDAAIADAQKAAELDRCEGAFEEHNYDCYVNHLALANAFGARGGPEDAQRAVDEAKKAIAFYPEQPKGYYMAAYYLNALGEVEAARDYGSLYLEHADDGEVDVHLNWARRLVSGSGFPDDPTARQDETEPATVFIEDSGEGDIDPDGPPLVSLVTFSEERTLDPPLGARYLTNDRPQLWAYFEFDNAADVSVVFWEWTQDSYVHLAGAQIWPGINKGRGWILLENVLVGENSRNILSIKFDQEEVASQEIPLRDEPYVRPLAFFADAELRESLLFYSGTTSPIYAFVDYVAIPSGSNILWLAEKDGLQVGTGVIEAEESGQTIVPIALAPDTPPGLVQIRLYLDGAAIRNAALVIAPLQTASAPPFQRLEFGVDPDLEGNFAQTSREFTVGQGEFLYVLDGISFPPQSVLTVRWTLHGNPLTPRADTFEGPEAPRRFIGLIQGVDGYLAPGEYQVLVSLDGEAVYADTVVVE